MVRWTPHGSLQPYDDLMLWSLVLVDCCPYADPNRTEPFLLATTMQRHDSSRHSNIQMFPHVYENPQRHDKRPINTINNTQVVWVYTERVLVHVHLHTYSCSSLLDAASFSQQTATHSSLCRNNYKQRPPMDYSLWYTHHARLSTLLNSQ
jgi:hypothetical protein